ncbi:hypothetical protein BJX68DRAFT_91131 [Aspergillus pseudodeflectus]|uniref:Zn(2)-C6 fungal-type domain-containing protein n=1 Tax=Aspergillus pseudodeflectus TaxID=176178 RepID=A0ABR4KF64_9EURO
MSCRCPKPRKLLCTETCISRWLYPSILREKLTGQGSCRPTNASLGKESWRYIVPQLLDALLGVALPKIRRAGKPVILMRFGCIVINHTMSTSSIPDISPSEAYYSRDRIPVASQSNCHMGTKSPTLLIGHVIAPELGQNRLSWCHSAWLGDISRSSIYGLEMYPV